MHRRNRPDRGEKLVCLATVAAIALAVCGAAATEPVAAAAESTIDPANWPRLRSPLGTDPELEAGGATAASPIAPRSSSRACRRSPMLMRRVRLSEWP